jgi:RNA-directed DNA polymerase
LAHRLSFSINELKTVADEADSLYKFDKQPKKSGGFRIISKPFPRLKRIQSKIHVLLTEIKVSDSAHGGIKGLSILTNARVHCNSKEVINFDIKSFFPSISHIMVFSLIHCELGCSGSVASLLTRLSTVNGQVPQGGPMSSDIANLVLRDVDKRLEGLAKRFRLKYTRYIDDMTFSGDRIPVPLREWVNEIISQSKFELKKEKESLMKKNRAQKVTGLNVNRKRPTVPRGVRREIRREAYLFENFEAEALDDAERLERRRKIQGKLAYIGYIKRKESAL